MRSEEVTLEMVATGQLVAKGWIASAAAEALRDTTTFVLSRAGKPIEWLAVQSQTWDSQVLQRSCARIAQIGTCGEQAILSEDFYSGLPSALIQLGLNYVVVRRPTGEWDRVHALERSGFRILDAILTFTRKLGAQPERKSSSSLRLASSLDATAVALLSAQSFPLSRFHNDPVLTLEQSRNVHYEWAKNSCLGLAAKAVWIAEEKETLSGFITWPESAGKGIGSALVNRSLEWFAQQGCTQVHVQTQIDNHAAIQLYSKLGFSVMATGMTLRWAGLST